MHNMLRRMRDRRAAGDFADSSDKGFTLIELLVVVVIIGILIAIAIPLYLNYEKGAHDKSAQSDLRGAISTLEQCNTANSTYPSAVGADGAMTGCSGQTITLGDSTKLGYVAVTSGSTTSSYTLVADATDGSGKMYCYNSANGGSVKAVTNTGSKTAPAGTC